MWGGDGPCEGDENGRKIGYPVSTKKPKSQTPLVFPELRQIKKAFQCYVDSLKITLKDAVLGGMKMEIAGFLTASYGVVTTGFFG